MTVRRRLLISGQVQGVFFRDSTRQAAGRAGVAGWVRNADDGTVEVVLEGSSEAVAQVEAWCGSGPSGASVSSVEGADEPPEGIEGFSVR